MNRKTHFLLLSLSIILCSCTIEKRLFQPGYHIEWKKKISEKNAEESAHLIVDSKKESDSTTTTSSCSLSVKPDQIQPPALTQSIPDLRVSIENPDIPISAQVKKNDSKPSKPQKKAIDPEYTEDRKEFEIFGVISFGFYFCSITLTILGLIVFNLTPFLLVIAAFMIILSLIFGIISVDKYRRDRSRYYRNIFGYFGLIASLATISLVIGFFILITALGAY